MNYKNISKLVFVAIVMVAMNLVSCKKDNEDSGSTNTLGGSQSPIGAVGNSFRITGNIIGIATDFSAEIVDLDNDGVSTISVSANITNATYLSMLASLLDVEISETMAVSTQKCRFTSEGIQSIFPEGPLNVVKYNAKVGDVYTLKTADGKTIHREVTTVSNENNFAWNGMNIKTIHVKETGRGISGFNYVEYVCNHRFGAVAINFFFTDGMSITLYLVSNATN